MPDTIEKVYRSGLKFLAPLNAQETYRAIVLEAMKLVNAEHGSILLMKDGKFTRVYATNPLFFNVNPRPKGWNYKVYKSGKPKMIRIQQLSRIHPEFKDTALRSVLLIPLTNHGKTIGVLSVLSSKEAYFTIRDLKILNLFTPMASLAIRKTELYEEVNQALEARDLFISMASHELRTPLTAVNGYINLIQSKVNGKDQTLSRWVDSLSAESLRLTLLIKELLEINRIKSGRLHYYLKVCHLIEVINRAISNFSFSYGDRIVHSSISVREKSDTVIGDFDKLLQVVINALENAAKFSPKDKHIWLSLKSRRDDLVITVKDEGIGIKKEELSEILKNFVRGSNTDTEGMGLGLYLVNEIVTRHQGNLNIKSTLNKGTKVEITLPKARI